MMIKKISVKYALIIVAVFASITIVFIPIYLYAQKNLFINLQINNMSDFCDKFVEEVNITDKDDIEDYLEDFNENGYRIKIFDKSKSMVYTNKRDNNKDYYQSPVAADDEEPEKTTDFTKYSADSVPKFIANGDNGNEAIVLHKQIDFHGEKYYISCRERIRNLETIFSYTNSVLVAVLLIYIAVCGMSLFFLMNRLTKSVRQLNSAVKQIAKKDYSVRYEGKVPKDEVGELAVNFNDMADTIQENINSIKNYNFLLREDINNLKKYENMRNKFVRTTTHELKTPLAIISGQVEMMNCTTDEEKRKYYFNSVIEEIQNMSTLITGFLQYSAEEKDTLKAKPEELELSETIEELCKKIQCTMQSKGLSFEFQIEKGILLNISEKHVEHIFNNYVINALKHTAKGKKIKVTLKTMGEVSRLSVYNDGNRIPDNQTEKIWSEFYSHDKQSDDNVGLGLFIVKEISLINNMDCGLINRENGVEFWFDFYNNEAYNQIHVDI